MPSPSFVFTSHTKIKASEVNANFALLLQCLGLSGGTLTGTLTARAITASADNTYDIGATATAFRNIIGRSIGLVDTNQSHKLNIVCGSDITADKTLTLVPGNSNRQLTFTADASIGGTASGTNTGDQNCFGTVAVSGQSDVVADQVNDTLTFVAGANVTLTTSAGGDSVTIAASATPATDLVPTGSLLAYAAASAPTGYLLCDGSAVSRSTYSALFGIIGAIYGGGNGSTTFNVPDMRQKFPLGIAASGTGNALALSGGTIDHLHTGPSHTHTGPSHTHTVVDHTHTYDDHSAGPDGGGTVSVQDQSGLPISVATFDHTHRQAGTTSASGAQTSSASGTGATGASGTGNTGTANPPYLVVQWIIKT